MTDNDFIVIEPDSDIGKQIGFTSENFDGYLCWGDDDVFFVSFIVSRRPGMGNLRNLFQNIINIGITVAVPTPSNRMRSILKRLGFKQRFEWSDEFGDHIELFVSQ
jgi:hypothetical protein